MVKCIEFVLGLAQFNDLLFAFKPQLGKNNEIYINDMVVKSKVVSGHLGDFGGIFDVLRRHKLRLNASKCSFGMGLGKFLGDMVTHRGIEVNLD